MFESLVEKNELDIEDGKNVRLITKSSLRLCKNHNCYESRRASSAYCQRCSDKHNKK